MEELNVTQNEVCVEGYLQEVNLTEGTDKNGKPYVRGSVIISVDQPVTGGVEEHEEIKVDVYAGMYKNDGGENPAYKSIRQLNEWKRMTTDPDCPDKIRFNRGTLQESLWTPPGATKPVSIWRINNSFFSKITRGDFEPRAVFIEKIFIREIEDEIRDDETTGRLVIKGVSIGYGSVAHVITYFVEDPKAVAYIRGHWAPGDTVRVGGRIRVTAAPKSKPREVEGGFGEEIDTGSSGTRRELIITSGKPNSYDDEEALDEGAIRAAMDERARRAEAAAAPKTSAKRATTNARRASW